MPGCGWRNSCQAAGESRWEQIKDTTSGSSSRNCDAWEVHRMSPRTRVAAEAGGTNAQFDTRLSGYPTEAETDHRKLWEEGRPLAATANEPATGKLQRFGRQLLRRWGTH